MFFKDQREAVLWEARKLADLETLWLVSTQRRSTRKTLRLLSKKLRRKIEKLMVLVVKFKTVMIDTTS